MSSVRSNENSTCTKELNTRSNRWIGSSPSTNNSANLSFPPLSEALINSSMLQRSNHHTSNNMQLWVQATPQTRHRQPREQLKATKTVLTTRAAAVRPNNTIYQKLRGKISKIPRSSSKLSSKTITMSQKIWKNQLPGNHRFCTSGTDLLSY